MNVMLLPALMIAAVPAFAQDASVVGSGPIGRAVSSEAHRLALHAAPSAGEPGRVPDTASDSNWSKVQELDPGTTVIVTVNASAPVTRYFLVCSQSSLTVLRLASHEMPAAVRSALIDEASDRPASFLAAQRGERVTLDGKVTVGPEGVFLADRKVAELDEIIEDIQRSDVTEVRELRRHVGRHLWRGALVGAGIGALIAGISTSNNQDSCGEYCSVPEMATAGAIVGGALGTGFGAIIGAAVPRTPDLIYRTR